MSSFSYKEGSLYPPHLAHNVGVQLSVCWYKCYYWTRRYHGRTNASNASTHTLHPGYHRRGLSWAGYTSGGATMQPNCYKHDNKVHSLRCTLLVNRYIHILVVMLTETTKFIYIIIGDIIRSVLYIHLQNYNINMGFCNISVRT